MRGSNMALPAGTRLGPYEVLSLIGAGGMGEVYRARDTRLDRHVALKILPASTAADLDRIARFDLEARAAAALSHPNILTIYDVGTENGTLYIASELVVGVTLSTVISSGPLPTRRLLDLAVQMADGMAAAHASGIVHRDLKPTNIMVASDGRIKILDFGLARQIAFGSEKAAEALTRHETEPGTMLGTVSYMSPEQARGTVADHRSDQFSFGLIVYEMVSGKRAFVKTESVQVLSAILTDEPTPLDARVPAPLRWVIDRCLAKNPADRYESPRDLYRELLVLRDHLSEASTVTGPATTHLTGGALGRGGLRRAVAAFVLIPLLALAAIALLSRPPAPDPSNFRFTPFAFEAGGQNFAVWSPNGKAVAYAAALTPEAPWQVFIRYLDSPVPLQLTHDLLLCSRSRGRRTATASSSGLTRATLAPAAFRRLQASVVSPNLGCPFRATRGTA